MRTKLAWVSGLVAAALLTVMSVEAQQAAPPGNAALPEMPKQTTRTGKHVNRVIDMWLKNQPVYYAQISGGDSPAADKGRAFTKRTDPW